MSLSSLSLGSLNLSNPFEKLDKYQAADTLLKTGTAVAAGAALTGGSAIVGLVCGVLALSHIMSKPTSPATEASSFLKGYVVGDWLRDIKSSAATRHVWITTESFMKGLTNDDLQSKGRLLTVLIKTAVTALVASTALTPALFGVSAVVGYHHFAYAEPRLCFLESN
jgi:hypothetical protein